jgi:hypothetical protein
MHPGDIVIADHPFKHGSNQDGRQERRHSQLARNSGRGSSQGPAEMTTGDVR